MKSIIQQFESHSLLQENEMLKPRKKVSVAKSLVSSPILTPLVDVFAILVIYLLIQSVNPTSLKNPNKDIQLPSASYAETADLGFSIQVATDGIYIEEQRVNRTQLVEALNNYTEQAKEKGEKPRLTIISDKRTPYATLSPIVEDCSNLGIEEIQFAIIRSSRS